MAQQPWAGPAIYGGQQIDPVTGLPVVRNPTMGMPSPAQKKPGIMDRLGGLLGGGQSYGGLLSEQDQKAAQRQVLLAMGAQLMSSGGWSPQKTSFGQALGPALMAGQQAQRQAGEDMLQAMLLKTQLQPKKSKLQEEYEYAKAQGFEGTPEEWRRVSSAQAVDPAAVREWQVYSKLSPEEQKRYLEMKRALQIETIQQVPTVVSGQGLTPLSTLGGEASAAATMAGAEAGAKAQATGTVEANFEQQKKSVEFQNSYKLYETARDGMMSGLEGSVTGPVSGRIPAVTAAQQTAEGGVAAMAPVLKQLFRSAGEGIFTDKDQELLLSMVPTRTDHPEARKAKMANIDAIVKAKLRVGAQPAATKKRYNPQTGKIE